MPSPIIPDHQLTEAQLTERLEFLEETMAYEICKPDGEQNTKWVTEYRIRIPELNKILKAKAS